MTSKFYIQREPWSMTTSLYFSRRFENSIARALPAIFEASRIDDGESLVPCQPLLSFGDQKETEIALQSLMDELWAAGIRPQNESTIGQLSALRAHLNDFRAITGKILAVELPKSD